VFVHVGADRSHIIQVEEQPDGWDLSGMVADERRLERADLDAAEFWRRNRLLNLVGYVVDQEGNAGVTACFLTQVRRLSSFRRRCVKSR
jgi:hypothetical protein